MSTVDEELGNGILTYRTRTVRILDGLMRPNGFRTYVQVFRNGPDSELAGEFEIEKGFKVTQEEIIIAIREGLYRQLTADS
jgi:hypothetical protein